VAIGGYQWLLVPIILMDIGGYWWLLTAIGTYSINDY
jgi:hypothetical protein